MRPMALAIWPVFKRYVSFSLQSSQRFTASSMYLKLESNSLDLANPMPMAYAAGADAVMVGRMLAGTRETPGDIIREHGKNPVKVYRGMASPEAQIDWRGKYSSNEGVSRTVPLRGPAVEALFEIDKGIRSGVSYSGARNIRELAAVAQFIEQSQAGAKESSTHIDIYRT